MQVTIVSNWNLYLNNFPPHKKDVYFYEEYIKLEENSDAVALCVICEEDDRIMLMPFLRKKIETYYDFETPYGYGGFISNSDNNEWNTNALKKIYAHFTDNGYLAGFIRFHPLLDNASMCEEIFPVHTDRKTVIIKTDVPTEEIWQNQLSSKNRNMIRKAQNNLLLFERDNEFKYLKEFIELYNATMSRRNADDFYFFYDEYYKKFSNFFSGKGFIGCIKKDSKIISAGLFMYENFFGHYHLSGSDSAYSSLGANNFLLWKVACEMQREGVKEFHLGGGTNSDENNSLFKFKKSFSKELKQFTIGKCIFNQEAYIKICNNWEMNNPNKVESYKNILLKYRY